MKKLLDPGYWGRALQSPIVLTGLAVDLAPIAGVFMWGWGAGALVMLYWIENIIAGVMTLPRILISSGTFGGFGILAGAFMSVFFIFHYGMFCAVHGTFLMVFLSFDDLASVDAAPIMDIPGMINVGLASGVHMVWLVGVICAWQVLVFVWEFLIKGGWKSTTPLVEMFAPYQRIVVLHIGIFAGAGALLVLGQPMIGVLALIIFKATFGVTTNAALVEITPLDESHASARAKFEAMMRGEKEPG